MTIPAQLNELKRLVRHLASELPATHGAIPWAAPVLMFGQLSCSRVATLGLNPSNLEFVDRYGVELDDDRRRFHSLSSLGLLHWNSTQSNDVKSIWNFCESYFQRNPYDGWFKRLDRILGGLGVSYYDQFSPACHLDLVPFATSEKWSALQNSQRQALGKLGAASLVSLLRASDIRVLVLNGMSVVREFSNLMDVTLPSVVMKPWLLPNSRGGVTGLAFEHRLSEIQGKALNREILVLGYNHNIQSSFGVTNEVILNIAAWVAKRAKGIEL
ncbi:MAG: hypothetical protein Q7K57_12185 [Burkholderiaceae bacterium]|nr:hypothetical protein [Burkholderiaceae bacterium]